MTELYQNFATALSEKTGIDTKSAEKVVTWLIAEGVLDAPVVADTFTEE